jgi:uncharacterized SAM-binding protein YcdF (DUF218 family)
MSAVAAHEPVQSGSQRSSSKARRPLLLLLLAVAAALVLAHPLWLPSIGRFLVVHDPLQRSDALVVLGGGERDRVEHGARLFHAGYASWFIVTDNPLNLPGVRASYAELMSTEAIWQGVPAECILTAPGMAETTYQEALAVRHLVQERGLHSLTVVTDPQHTRRARMAFHDVFRGTGVPVSVQAVQESWYEADSWWRTERAVRATWTEYAALILYRLGYR